MAHLAGEPVEEHVLDAIKEYEERLKKRLDDNDVKDKELATRVEEYNSTWEGEEEGPSIVRDEIMEKVACLPASSYSAKPIRIQPIFMSIIFHHYKQLERLSKERREGDSPGHFA